MNYYVYDHAYHSNQNRLMDLTTLRKFDGDMFNYIGIRM